MRFLFLLVTCFCGLLSFAKDTPKAMLVSHNDIKGPIIGNMHTEDFEIFADGRVRYSESGNDRKTGTFNIKAHACAVATVDCFAEQQRNARRAG